MDLDALLQAYREGQPGSMRELLHAAYHLVMRVNRGRCPDSDLEDLAQDTVVIVLRKLDEIPVRGPGSVAAWVLRTAQNLRYQGLAMGRSPSELARVERVSVSTIRTRAHRAREQLKELMRERRKSFGGIPATIT